MSTIYLNLLDSEFKKIMNAFLNLFFITKNQCNFQYPVTTQGCDKVVTT